MTATSLSPQCLQILRVLYKKGVITPLNALVNYGIARLAARIHELKAVGFNIITEFKKVNGKRYASYRLVIN